MKNFILLVFIISSGCCSSPKNATSVTIANTTTAVPGCIQKLIHQFSEEEKQNPPRKIYSYLYKGAKVYYVIAPCCDNFNDLYDEYCTLLGHPDGGFTGRGDGKFPDFNEAKTNEKLIWEDKRK